MASFGIFFPEESKIVTEPEITYTLILNDTLKFVRVDFNDYEALNLDQIVADQQVVKGDTKSLVYEKNLAIRAQCGSKRQEFLDFFYANKGVPILLELDSELFQGIMLDYEIVKEHTTYDIMFKFMGFHKIILAEPTDRLPVISSGVSI